MVPTNANFSRAIIDNKELVDYLKEKHAKNVPDTITNNEELILKLQEKGYAVRTIEKIER